MMTTNLSYSAIYIKKGVHEHMPYLLDIAFVRQELQQVYKHLTNKQKNALHTKIIFE